MFVPKMIRDEDEMTSKLVFVECLRLTSGQGWEEVWDTSPVGKISGRYAFGSPDASVVGIWKNTQGFGPL